VNEKYSGYTSGYNRPLVANRVHDILTAVAFVKNHERTKVVHLVGFDEAGPWVLLARALCGDAVSRTAADFNRFRFDSVNKTDDPMMLPGGLQYGGLPGLAALIVPSDLFVHNVQGTGAGHWLNPAYAAAGATSKLIRMPEKATDEQVVDWLCHEHEYTPGVPCPSPPVPRQWLRRHRL
jgi:hypothetical protein